MVDSWAEFHEATAITARFGEWPPNQTLLYAALGLANEAGEAAGAIKKAVRDDGGEITQQRRQDVIDELGDVLWYAARVAETVDARLDEAAEANIAKVNRRLANGTLAGRGDR